ncbi:type II toxin-antitoxin system HicB family antitoxin [Halalkalibacter kiskunsagensis]|uniref:Type II toxin-antitoxin system HicB family antitoxin n=1 Tax=Halalkalibacter kiskunsagensis TaxID=1548599 RepID=A0ABV6KMG4_9BACI
MTTENRPFYEEYKPEQFSWRVRKVYNWRGGFEFLIELHQLDGCESFGETMREAKVGLKESLHLWIRTHGQQQLPDIRDGAHLIYLDPPMQMEEFEYINRELKKLKG